MDPAPVHSAFAATPLMAALTLPAAAEEETDAPDGHEGSGEEGRPQKLRVPARAARGERLCWLAAPVHHQLFSFS